MSARSGEKASRPAWICAGRRLQNSWKCSISGRGTVVTGRVERGVVKAGEEVEIVGIKDTVKTVVTGVEMFRKLLDEGRAGENVGALLRAALYDLSDSATVL